jgi:hypothetical protein
LRGFFLLWLLGLAGSFFKKINTSWNDDWDVGQVVFNHFLEGSLKVLCSIMNPLF